MKVSLKATYGIMAIVDLALQMGALPFNPRRSRDEKGFRFDFLSRSCMP